MLNYITIEYTVSVVGSTGICKVTGKYYSVDEIDKIMLEVCRKNTYLKGRIVPNLKK